MLTEVLLSTVGYNMVNDEVSKVYESISNKLGKHLTLTPAQRWGGGLKLARELLSTASPPLHLHVLINYKSSGFPSSLLHSSSSLRVWGRSISTYTHGSL